MKICVLCDLHLPEREDAVQYDFFNKAIENITQEKPEMVITAGDITASGEMAAFEYFTDKIKQFSHITILGNSDVRFGDVQKMYAAIGRDNEIAAGIRKIIGINTPYGKIDEYDRERLCRCGKNDVVIMHHSMQGLVEESREFLTDWANDGERVIIHGHSHKRQDYFIGSTRVIGLRALDPDKSIGDVPCIAYFNIYESGLEFEESLIDFGMAGLEDMRSLLGISCFSPETDIPYATKRNIKHIEIRKYEIDEKSNEMIADKVKVWRENGGKTVSVHMPNIYWREDEMTGLDAWDNAVKLSEMVSADHLTIHPPRTLLANMKKGSRAWNELLKVYASAIKQMPETTTVGIENLHTEKGERDDEFRCFGYTPSDLESWIDAINENFGYERAGFQLDVGHAKNNPPINQKLTLGMWYAIIGKKIQAYHIHQVISGEDGDKNHKAIENWYGPLISYASFFRAWQKGQINHRPMFLEVRSRENCEISIASFERLFKNKF